MIRHWLAPLLFTMLLPLQAHTPAHECPPACEGEDVAVFINQQKTSENAAQNHIDDDFILVKGGQFTMGSPENENDRCSDETQHEVKLSDFYMSKYEVTNGEFVQFLNAIANDLTFSANGDEVRYNDELIFDMYCGGKKGGCIDFTENIVYNNGSKAGGRFMVTDGYEQHPVIMVTWYGANAYTQWLSQKKSKNYRLPTEAEWEFAARGGHQSKGYLYAGSNDIAEVAWYYSNSYGKTHLVGKKKANELGLYDMSGNIWEWCSDWYGTYPTEIEKDPSGPSFGSQRIIRGGNYNFEPRFCRVSCRFNSTTVSHSGNLGFRLARMP